MEVINGNESDRKMAMIGRVPEFFFYLEWFKRWLSANDIAAEKKADMFLSVLCPTEYELLKNLYRPRKVIELMYKEITEPF